MKLFLLRWRLSRSYSRHVVMLAQIAQVSVELLHTLLVRLSALALETLIELTPESAAVMQ